jgi:hypothetical protein
VATIPIVDDLAANRKLLVTLLAEQGAECDTWILAGDTEPGILGTVAATRGPLRGVNVGGDPSNLQLPLHHPEIRTFLAAPIASPTHVYGWICLVGNEGPPGPLGPPTGL